MGGSTWRRDLARDKERASEIALKHQMLDDDPPHCVRCNKIISPPRRYRHNVIYCGERCLEKAKRARIEMRAQQKEASLEGKLVVAFDESEVRRGPSFEAVKTALTEDEWADWIDRQTPDTVIAERFSLSKQHVAKMRRAGVNDMLAARAAIHFDPSSKNLKLLGPSDEEMQELLASSPAKFELKLDELTTAFTEWRDRFIELSPGVKFITKNVHKRWIRATLKTIYTGGRHLILSPPRHGKTELLIHFCEWLICRNPDIRILWIGPNLDIAENCLGQVRDVLESHEALQKAYLAPGETWAPVTRQGGAIWQRSKFTVSNRNYPQKQPTMWASGVGGAILSLDADFIIVDDPADPDKSQAPAGRNAIEKWFRIKLISRKMMHTGLAMLASRVHPDDLYNPLIDMDLWEKEIDKAHDVSICGKGLYDPHDNEDCVLFPEVNPLSYLREQAADVGDHLFDMMYLNQPRPDGTMIFDPDLIRELCLDPSRAIGMGGVPADGRMVAALDPAARGVQAAFLWSVHLHNKEEVAELERDPFNALVPETYYMIDLETQRAGGIEGALKVMEEWHENYDCRLWIIEDNSYQTVFFDDPRVKALCQRLDIVIKPHTTGANKHDMDFGVASTAPLYHTGKVNLPYSGGEAVRKVDMFIRQLINFTGAASGRSRKKSDILMASWFPFADLIPKWKKDTRAIKVSVSSHQSYPGWQRTTDDDYPWGRTAYPYPSS